MPQVRHQSTAFGGHTLHGCQLPQVRHKNGQGINGGESDAERKRNGAARIWTDDGPRHGLVRRRYGGRAHRRIRSRERILSPDIRSAATNAQAAVV